MPRRDRIDCRPAPASGLEFVHLLLDGLRSYQPVDKNRLVLPDAVRAVDRLLFDSRIPPGIENNDGVGSRQVETHSPRLQADQENIARPVLKVVDGALAVFGFSGQQAVADMRRIELDRINAIMDVNCEKMMILRPSLRSSSTISVNRSSLAAGRSTPSSSFSSAGWQQACRILNKASSTTMWLFPGRVPDGRAHLGRHRQANGIVEVALAAFQDNALDDLGLRRQLCRHLGLGPAKQERLDPLGQCRRAALVGALFDWRTPLAGECSLFAQKTRIGETHDRPEFSQMIFHGSSGQAEAVFRFDAAQPAGRGGIRILDGLRFVENGDVPFADSSTS